MKFQLERRCESQEYLFVPLHRWRGHSLLAIHPVGDGKRTAAWAACPSAFRQPHQRVLRAGCSRVVSSPVGVYAPRGKDSARALSVVAVSLKKKGGSYLDDGAVTPPAGTSAV